MSVKILIKDLVQELSEENDRLLRELRYCRQLRQLFDKYRHLVFGFNANCLCNENTANKTQFNELEVLYDRVVVERCHQMDDNSDDKLMKKNTKSVNNDIVDNISDNNNNNNKNIKVKTRTKRRLKSSGEQTPKQRIRVKAFCCQWTACGKKFRESGELLAHIRLKHTNERPFMCSECPKTFPVERYLKIHQKTHATDKPFKCRYTDCPYESRSLQSLNEHHLRHENERPFGCTESDCGKSYYTKTALKRHAMHAHSQVRPFSCDWPGCESRFKCKQRLDEHKAFHLNERKFLCDYDECGKSFCTKKMLQNHRARHLKLYVCSWPACGQRFAQNFLLAEHMNRHQDLRPFKCRHTGCSLAFYSKILLNRHVRESHREVMITTVIVDTLLNL
ncbi:zinc finger protein OZF-like [Oppia nitens]|uniref:zinc finger protein OZF-like n=1 Tax=Oppia nitens TaxID=1686743 RepID=UPI0023DA190C|nr:zinc finger protein OZF-like [Oppia nitens]